MVQFDNIGPDSYFEVVIYFDDKKSLLLGIESIKFTMMESKINSTPNESIEKTKDAIIDIYDEPVMQTAINVLPIIGKHSEVTLRARGNSISKAVTVALIITDSILKGNSKIHKITVGSEPIKELGEIHSTIEIILKKN